MSTPGGDLGKLSPWCRAHGLEITPEQLDKLDNYLKLLKIWAARVSLIGISEVPVLATKHLPDCLFAAAHCPQSGRAADLGSGAGLPGIPLAIVRPGLEVDLVESRAKKISFLTEATRDVPNATVRPQRIEKLHRTYDVVVARALAPLDRLLPLARPTLLRGGQFLAMKSSSFARELTGIEPRSTGFSLTESVAYELPSGEHRTLLKFVATRDDRTLHIRR